MGRLSLPSFFNTSRTRAAAEVDPSLAGEDGGEGLTTPLGRAGAVLKWGVVAAASEVVRQGTHHCRWSTGAGALSEALPPLGGKAIDPLAQRGVGKVARVRDGWEARPCDDCAYGLGTPEHAGLPRLLQDTLEGGAGHPRASGV